MNIETIVAQRNIEHVLHFTTNLGLLGILHCKAVKSRKRLPEDKRLEFILQLNTPIVKDPAWVDYVNLSIGRINAPLYDISASKWHPRMSWRILSFDPDVLAHADVWFATTNNIYPSVKRGQGALGLQPLFGETILGRYGTIINRTADMPASWPTCIQAEVLYPRELSTEHLKCIFVPTDEDQDDVSAQIAGVWHAPVPVIVDTAMFSAKG